MRAVAEGREARGLDAKANWEIERLSVERRKRGGEMDELRDLKAQKREEHQGTHVSGSLSREAA